MAVALIVSAEADRVLVEQEILPVLPVLDFDRWLSSGALPTADAIADAITSSDAIFIVVSNAAAESSPARAVAAQALPSDKPLIPLCADDTNPERIAEGLSALATINVRIGDTGDFRPYDYVIAESLEELLSLEPSERHAGSETGLPIPWSASTFSRCLAHAVSRRDFEWCDNLVTAFERQVPLRTPYPTKTAHNDLDGLRKKRQFHLMCRYAQAVIDSGNNDLRVRRQFGQALIERGRFDQAIQMLSAIVSSSDPGLGEVFEARGLIGRAYKQQYVNAPTANGAGNTLTQAIQEYRSAYDDSKRRNTWTGINAVSCILRGSRDGLPGCDLEDAGSMAQEILKEIARLRAANALTIFDVATHVEALVAVGEFDHADETLSEYLVHPKLEAFEVTSTCRQFDELLQLAESPDGRPLLDRLWRAVGRIRASGIVEDCSDTGTPLPLLVRAVESGWRPERLPDLTLHSQVGAIFSIEGTKRTIRKLLLDPAVLAIEESRPTPSIPECHRSLPFVRVRKRYGAGPKAFSEDGAHALVALIDDGIDWKHQAFTDQQGGSRIVGIWDQRDETGPPPEGFSYGTFHSSADIARYLAGVRAHGALDRNPKGHGTHVASIAAGRRVGTFAGGVAPEAKLLAVIANATQSIGYSRAHVDALNFIDGVATRLGMPVAINVSLGMNGGGHDGSSDLEGAFDVFSRKRGRVIVKSAGNERDKRAHAAVPLVTPVTELLSWTRHDPFWPLERLEAWWHSSNRVRVRLGAPTDERSPWVRTARPDITGRLGGAAYRLQVSKPDDRDAIRLQVDIGGKVNRAFPGTWTLEFFPERIDLDPVAHVWLERNGGEASTFEDHADENMTLSIPATARSVIVVGAINARRRMLVGRFSSYGPTRDGRHKPDLAAPGLEIHAAQAGTDDQVVHKDGTSQAAPHVTGAVALVLSRAVRNGRQLPTAGRIGNVLRQKAAGYTGHWHPGLGYGVLDVTALLAAFDR